MTDQAHDPDKPAVARLGCFRRRGPRAAIAAVVVAVIVVAVMQARAAPRPTDLQRTSGERAPAIHLPDLVDPDRTIDLRDVAGRPVVLNFWASWCVPCRREMPTFPALYERFGDRVALIGINHQDRRSNALDLLTETGVRYPTGHDPDGQVARAYGLFGMPTTVFISADGAILARRTGEIDADELERTIDDLLLQP